MRTQLRKLVKTNSTKGERRIGEILKRNRIKFTAKARVCGREIDFLIGRLAVEVDGSVHKQTDAAKDTMLFANGYVPIHISTKNLKAESVEKQLLELIKLNCYVNSRHRH